MHPLSSGGPRGGLGGLQPFVKGGGHILPGGHETCLFQNVDTNYNEKDMIFTKFGLTVSNTCFEASTLMKKLLYRYFLVHTKYYSKGGFEF